MGTQPLISYNYGAGNIKKLSGVIKRLIILTVATGAVTAVLVVALRRPVIALFLKDTAVALTAESILMILMISSPFLGFFYLATNFLQATGKAMHATIISALQKGVLLIPLLFILEYLYGFTGIRLAYVVADFGAVIISCIFMAVGWKRINRMSFFGGDGVSEDVNLNEQSIA